MTELKNHFELSMDVNPSDERLPWDFPRFLSAAGKKGRVLIIIDGLHRLRTSGADIGLKWLPLTFPPNVRMIISTTSPTLSGDEEGEFDTGNAEDDAIGASEGKKDRVLKELQRRNWRIIGNEIWCKR